MKELSIDYNKKFFEGLRIPLETYNKLISDVPMRDVLTFSVHNFFVKQNCPITFDDIRYTLNKSTWTDSDKHHVVNNNCIIEILKTKDYVFINVAVIEPSFLDINPTNS